MHISSAPWPQMAGGSHVEQNSMERFCHHRKFYWTVSLDQGLKTGYTHKAPPKSSVSSFPEEGTKQETKAMHERGPGIGAAES